MGNPTRQLTVAIPEVIPDVFLINGFTFKFAPWITQSERRTHVETSLADPKSYEPYVENDEYDRFCDPGTGLFLVIEKAA